MSYTFLHPGPPVLTVEAADAALDMIDMIAATVRGVDLIDVTNTVRPLWRQHLAASYSYLPPITRNWYATAPQVLTGLRIQWPMLAPWQQQQLVQQWAFELPQMMAMLDPVLAQAQAIDAQVSVQAHIQDWRNTAAQAQPTGGYASARQNYEQQQNVAQSLADHSVRMTNLTNTLMQAMSGRNPPI